MLQFGCADDGGRNAGLMQQPGQRDLRPRHAARLRHLGDASDDPLIGFFGCALEHAAEGFVGSMIAPIVAKSRPRRVPFISMAYSAGPPSNSNVSGATWPVGGNHQ